MLSIHSKSKTWKEVHCGPFEIARLDLTSIDLRKWGIILIKVDNIKPDSSIAVFRRSLERCS
jgi:hypothetical protein